VLASALSEHPVCALLTSFEKEVSKKGGSLGWKNL